MSKIYSFYEADVKINMPDGKRVAVFDISPTTTWVAVGDWNRTDLEVFKSTDEMLEFVARKQNEGAAVNNDDHWLDKQVQGIGFDTWEEFVTDQRKEFHHAIDSIHLP